jgi:HSP20 family molecular chaperone IbpA
MSLIPRPFVDADLGFTPFFRFLDDFSNYAGELQTPGFTPKFDIQEHKNSYSLHGELPGVERKDVEIEFTDPKVIVSRPISWRVDANDVQTDRQNPREIRDLI